MPVDSVEEYFLFSLIFTSGEDKTVVHHQEMTCKWFGPFMLRLHYYIVVSVWL